MGRALRRLPGRGLRKTAACLIVIAWASGIPFPRAARAQGAPDFILNDLAGHSRKLSDFFPRNVVLLNFWATWCVPCVKEFPHLQSLQDRFGDKGLQVMTVSIDGPDRLASVSSFVGRYGYTIPVLLDTESKVVSLYNPRLNIPCTVLIDRGGRIRYVHQGYSPGDEGPLEAKIAALLEEPATGPGPRSVVRAAESFLLRFPNGSAGQDGSSGRYSQVINQLDLTIARGGVMAGARLDSNLTFDSFDAGLRLAKRFAQYSTNGLGVRAGDFYASLGRGLVFSLVKVFEEKGLDYVIDTTVDGGQVSIGSGRLSGEIFGGWIDRPEDRSIHDKVIAGGLGWGGADSVSFRLQGVSAELEPGGEFGNHRVDQGSVSLNVPDLWGMAEIYGEFSLVRRRMTDVEVPVSGHGLYIGSKLHFGGFSLLLEMKDYKELNFEYARPPLLESEELDIVADQFDLDRTDVSAYSARIDYYRPGSRTLFFGKFLFLDDHPENHPLYESYDRKIAHVFAGIEKQFPTGFYLYGLAGWRWETDTSIAFMSTAGRTFHDQINASWPLGHGWSLETDWKHKVFRGSYLDYSEVRSALSLHKSPRWVLSALYERTTDPAVVALTGKKNWWAGQLEVRWAGGHAVRLFIGSTKGSTKCAGGVCRYFPPFKGVRFEAFLRF